MSPMVFSQNADVKDTETKLQFICKDEQKSVCSLSWGISPQFYADEGEDTAYDAVSTLSHGEL